MMALIHAVLVRALLDTGMNGRDDNYEVRHEWRKGKILEGQGIALACLN